MGACDLRLLAVALAAAGCGAEPRGDLRTFASGFEQLSDFAGFHLTPQGHLGTTYHRQSEAQVRSGRYSHEAWIEGANPPSTLTVNNNHRGYPTVQLHKREGGSFRCPCEVELWVWLDMPLQAGEWFSFATFTGDSSDAWSRTVLVNLSDEGFVHLMHVPNQGEGSRLFQTDTVRFPQRQWVRLEISLDLAREGRAVVYQDGVRVSEALVRGFDGELAQAHFGLYAPPSVASGRVFNDDLRIAEVEW